MSGGAANILLVYAVAQSYVRVQQRKILIRGGFNVKKIIVEKISGIQEHLWAISDYIYHNPELGMQEFKALDKLTELLHNYGFTIEKGICGYETSFLAACDSGRPGPTIAFICEYDALPEIGHGCGHNMIGVMGAGAGIGLSTALAASGGRVVVLGTPAEEVEGAKVAMVEQGVFDGVDVAMMVHPDGQTYTSGGSLAIDGLQFEFKGRSSHAAAMPEKGINALDAVIQTFNGINALRQHLTSDVRIHGIITHGGVAANIVPDYAVAQFCVRALQRKYLSEVVKKVKNCAQGAAAMTGAELTVSSYGISYDDMCTNQALSEAFNRNLLAVGELAVYPERSNSLSLDMGNVSHVVPAIHPYIGIGNPELMIHTTDMACATLSQYAHEALVRGAQAMACTGYEIISSPALLAAIKKEFADCR